MPTAGSATTNLAWLSSVREICFPVSRLNPIWVRESVIDSGPSLPQPTVPYPESHPYCEFTLSLQGRGIQSIGHENQKIAAGAVMLLGPNLPHKAELLEYPVHSITVYILPILFLEMGPNGDGATILKRFSAGQTIAERILYTPPPLRNELQQGMGQMLGEFKLGGLGSELRLRALLMEMLVSLLRWEASAGKRTVPHMVRADWSHIQKALHYMHEHHTEVIYVRQIAEALRVGERQLNGLFRELLGMGCIQYLNEYRVSLAASMLSTSSSSITTVAFQVGFETLSHFNTTFRKVIGMSPTEYVGRKNKREGDSVQPRSQQRYISRVSAGS